MNQDRIRDQDMPNRSSSMEPAEGSRENSEVGRGSDREQHRQGDQSPPNSGGITNRPLDREQCEQEQLPERGQSRSEQ